MKRTTAAVALALAAGASLVTVNRLSARPAALDEPTIVAIFDAANTFDIETGAFAAKRAVNSEVRDYGTMLSQVHTAVRQKGRELAMKLGVKATKPADFQMERDHAAVMKQLRDLEGAAFEQAFLKHEAAYHAAVLEAVKTSL